MQNFPHSLSCLLFSLAHLLSLYFFFSSSFVIQRIYSVASINYAWWSYYKFVCVCTECLINRITKMKNLRDAVYFSLLFSCTKQISSNPQPIKFWLRRRFLSFYFHIQIDLVPGSVIWVIAISNLTPKDTINNQSFRGWKSVKVLETEGQHSWWEKFSLKGFLSDVIHTQNITHDLYYHQDSRSNPIPGMRILGNPDGYHSPKPTKQQHQLHREKRRR